MSAGTGRLDGTLSDIDPVVAVCLPVAVAPFGYLIGSLFVSHLIRSEIESVWLTTVALIALSLLVFSWRS